MTEPAELPPPRRAPSERARMILDRALSASAGVVALSALLVSVYQAYISREQLRMSAWPYVMQGNTGADGWAWVVGNVGLGPALVRSMRVDVDGRPVTTWIGFTTAMLKADTAAVREQVRGHAFTTSTIRRGVVLLPGNSTELVRVGPGEFALTMRRLMNDPRASVRFCYCSLYEDCWVSDSRAREPRPVRECPDEGALDFQS